MNTSILLILTPFLTAGIGWLTNWVAIQMLFHPRVPINLVFWKWQGLIPRRQKKLAKEASEIIEREILQQNIISTELRKIDLKPYLDKVAHTIVWNRIGPQLESIPLIGSFINESTLAKFEVIAAASINEEAESIVEKVTDEFETKVNFKDIIENNIAAFDLDQLEIIVNQVAQREFTTIERLGAVLGFIVGCIQVILFILTGIIKF